MKKFFLGVAIASAIVVILIICGVSLKTIFFICATIVGAFLFLLFMACGVIGIFWRAIIEPMWKGIQKH